MKIGILGCAGRMGRMLIVEVIATPSCDLSGGIEPGGPTVGEDLGLLIGEEPIGIVVGTDTKALFAASDVVIDFTVAAAIKMHSGIAAETGTAVVFGTTGLGDDDRAAMAAAAKHVAVVQSPNMSLGVNILMAMTEKLAKSLGPEFDIDIVEMHHRYKSDAPSGTALGLGEAAAKGRGVRLSDVERRTRDGQTGTRPVGEIGFATLRGGDVVGDHTVIFAASGERVELTHKASSREIFARGAVRAAIWTKDRPPGLYSMRDVLSLN